MFDDLAGAQLIPAALQAAGMSSEGVDPAALGLLSLVLVLVLKHFLCDFVLQTNWQAANKGCYGHPASFVHTGQHIIGTAIVLFGLAAPLYAGVLVAEALVHYHIDWAKDRVTRLAGWTPNDQLFWVALGVDQMLHQITYVLIAVAILLYA